MSTTPLHKSSHKVYNPYISGLYTPTCKVKRPSSMVYNPVIPGCVYLFSMVFSYRVYNPVISGWCIHVVLCCTVSRTFPWYTTLLFQDSIHPYFTNVTVLLGYTPCHFRPSYTRHRIYSVPQSAGRHLSHNKPANRVFLLPRRPCISTGVNSGYTVRTRCS